MNLKEIEEKILEIKRALIQVRENNERRGGLFSIVEGSIEREQKPLKEQLEILETQRKHLLEKPPTLVQKLIWNVVIPITVSILTTFLLIHLGLAR